MTGRAWAIYRWIVIGALGVASCAGCGGGSTPPPQPMPTSLVSSTAGQLSAADPHRLVVTARWTHSSIGYRLHVRPSRYGRRHAAPHAAVALHQALAAAGASQVSLDSRELASLTDQLRCHAVYASLKPWWNLEAWRPDVGYRRTVLALCNPS
jgi:Protein of unknown function (DUF2599)